MRVLVTGGAGYVGSVAAERLVRSGHEVVVFDNLSTGHSEAVPADAHFVLGDLCDPVAVHKTVETYKPQVVMHFASFTQVGESVRNPIKYLRGNADSGLILLEAMVKYRVGKFVLSSTANIFDGHVGWIGEAAATKPGSPYGESKLYLERALAWIERAHGLKFAILRYFNAAGAMDKFGEDHDPETHLIPIALQCAMGQREKLEVFGTDYDTFDGTCVRDYVHVADLADAHLLAMKALDGGSRAYNLGNGKGFSVRQVIETVRLVTGKEIPTVDCPRRAGDPARLVADSTLIRKELGWKPLVSDLDGIVESAWRWKRDYPNGYPK